MLKKVAYSLLCVSFSAFGAAGSALVPFVIPEGASSLEILHAGRACLEEPRLIDAVWCERRRACLSACGQVLDEEIKQEKYDQLLPVATFLLKTLISGCNASNNIIEKCVFSCPSVDIFFLSDSQGCTILEKAIRLALSGRNIAKLKVVCSRISPEDFACALHMFDSPSPYRIFLWHAIGDPQFCVDMESSCGSNVKQLFDVVKEMKERVFHWARHVGLDDAQVVQNSLGEVYEKIVDKFGESGDEEIFFDPAVLLRVCRSGIEKREMDTNEQTVLKALIALKRMGIHPSNPFAHDKPEGESLFSAGLTYVKFSCREELDKYCALLSPEEFDVEIERLQRLDSFRWWYGELYQWMPLLWIENHILKKIYQAGHNALLQHQTLFTLLAPKLGEL